MALSWRLTWLILKRKVAQLHTRQRPISSGLQNPAPCTESLHHSFSTRYSSPLTFSKTQARFSMASRAGGAFEFEINPFNAIDEAASSDSSFSG